MILTNEEIMQINQTAEFDSAIGYARKIEQAVLESYKAELLKEAGEPVLYAEFAEDDGWLGDASEYADHLEEPHALFTSDQVAAAIAKAEQRVAEAIVDMLQQKHRNCFGAHSFYLAASVATANGEWRKFVKEV